MKFNIVNVALAIIIFMATCSIFGQEEYVALGKKADSVTVENITSRQILYNVFKGYVRDSVKLNYLLRHWQDKNYKHGEVFALNSLGSFYRNNSKYNKAIASHESALQKAKAINSIEQEIRALNMLGVVYRRKDAIRTALDYHQEALKKTDTIENPNETILKSRAVSLNSMGNIYLALEQYQKAIDNFKISLGIEQKVDNKLGMAINHHNIGYAKEALGDLDSALKYYNTSLAYNKSIHSKIGQVICNNSIGQLYLKQNKVDEAIKTIELSLDDAEKMNDKFHLSAIYNGLGLAYLKKGNYSKSKRYLDKGLKVSTEGDLKSAMVEANAHLSEYYKAQNNYKEALKYHMISSELNEALNDEKKFQYVNDIMLKYETEKIANRASDLAKENELVKLRLKRNKTILFTSAALIALIIVIMYILYRQQILKDEKRILTLEQDMLRSQMNPHFIFNSLNSIKHYIIANEQKNAVYYLNKFAKLIRKILEASKVKEVTLADELETMDLYMSIENIRFDNTINYEVFVDKDINLETVKVPPLVLQPFLENSLWHGLSSKKGDKTIKLKIAKTEGNTITLMIEDNGVGREKAKVITGQKITKKHSFGISITEQRLASFAKDYKLSFTDLIDGKNKALGTLVSLRIPA